jgi:hypothetical protein
MTASSDEKFPWLPVLGASLLIGMLSAAGAASLQRMEGRPVEVWPTLASTVPSWVFWGFAAWPVFGLTRRFPLASPFRVRNLLVHAGAAIALVLAHTLFTVWLGRMAYPLATRDSGWATWFVGFLSSRGVGNLLVYAALVGLFQAIEARGRLRRQALSAAHLETELARAQLHALQLQLQPHFLFNTLHAIGVLNQDDPVRATRMIASLGDLLRGSLDNRTAKEITLEKELGLLEHYLDIESVRFSDRLTVSLDVPPAVKPYLVPTFSLQPLVENAVRHGVARRVGGSRIRIGAAEDAGRLRLSVWNDGPAIDFERMEEGVGIATTRDRLKRLYGEAGRLELQNSDGGVLVTLEVPVHERPVL